MPTVREFMTKDVVTIDAEKTVFEAAELMCQKEISDLVVVDGKKPVGIVTERDFVRRVVAKQMSLNCKVTEIMSKPLWVVYADNSLHEAARKMFARKIRRLPVLEKNDLVGIITATDFMKQFNKKTITEEILEIFGHYSVPEFFDKPENPDDVRSSECKS
jgi:CBS domain-containing protein